MIYYYFLLPISSFLHRTLMMMCLHIFDDFPFLIHPPPLSCPLPFMNENYKYTKYQSVIITIICVFTISKFELLKMMAHLFRPLRLQCLFITFLAEAKNNENFLFYSTKLDEPFLKLVSAQENQELQYICGKKSGETVSERQFKMIGAEFAQPGQFPWAVSFALDGHNMCGGTLISRRHLLTAAHCFISEKEAECRYLQSALKRKGIKLKLKDFVRLFKILHGGVCLRADEDQNCPASDMREANITKVALPLLFLATGCQHDGADYAILELDRDLEFDERTSPICMPPRDENYSQMKNLIELGWGTAANRTKQPTRSAILRFLPSQLLNPSISQLHTYLRSRALHTTMKVAKGICSGDSGAALQATHISTNRAILIGIHSRASECFLDGKEITYGSQNNALSTSAWLISDIVCKLTGVCTPG